MNGIKVTHPAVNLLIEASREIHGDGIAAYLAFMAIRLFELHRVLKPTGSLFLHCDHTANGYLRQLLDGVFGKDNFRNEVIWCYTGPGSPRMRQFNRKHDTVFWYNRGDRWTFNRDAVRLPYKDGQPHTGGFTHQTGAKAGTNMDKEVADSYQKGKIPEDWWRDIALAIRSSNERTGYPTQKPIALAERIIQASSNPGDIVLDCFAGCAYAAVAAEKLGRQWVACDINPRAWTVFKRQFNKGGDLPLLTCNDRTTGQQVMGSEPTVTVHGPRELPRRTTTAEVESNPCGLRRNGTRPRGNTSGRQLCCPPRR